MDAASGSDVISKRRVTGGPDSSARSSSSLLRHESIHLCLPSRRMFRRREESPCIFLGKSEEIQAGETDITTRHPKGEFPRLVHDSVVKTCTFGMKRSPDGMFSNEHLANILETQ